MRPADFGRIQGLMKEAKHAELEALLARASLSGLAEMWSGLAPMQKLVAFKLLDAPRAMELYGVLPFKEKYFLLLGFPLNSIAPVLEGLPAAQRRHFVQLPRRSYDRMFRQLISESAEMTVTVGTN